MDRDIAIELVSALSDIKDALGAIKEVQEDILEVLTPAPDSDDTEPTT